MMDCPFLVYSILLGAIPTLVVLNFVALIWFKTLSNEMKLEAKEKLSVASKMNKAVQLTVTVDVQYFRVGVDVHTIA